jgi:hypothetical protein
MEEQRFPLGEKLEGEIVYSAISDAVLLALVLVLVLLLLMMI